MLFFMGIFYWILEASGYTLLHHALLAIYLGFYFGCFGLAFTFISRRLEGTPALWAAPFLWVFLEYIRSNLSFLALPWTLLAHSQDRYPVMIQIASVTGTYGISFLIVMVNAALASLFLGRLKSPLPFAKGDAGGFRISTKGKVSLVITAASFLLFTLVYGYLTTANPIAGDKIKLSLVQGNIEQSKKWDPKYAGEIMATYSGLTLKASKANPALIIWPETATPGSISADPTLLIEIKEIAERAGTYLLLGSAQHQKFEGKEPTTIQYLNSAYLIHPDPKVIGNQRYDKIRLFPFGEYLPFKEWIPWSLINVRESGSYRAGKEFTLFELPPHYFGVTICWENVFPDLVRQFVKRGARFVVNMTNEARFGKTAAPYQLSSMSVFRAVENRIYVIRCANTGVSCIIDPHGRITDRISDEKGRDIFIQGIMTAWITPLESKTIYTQYGNWFIWVAIGGSALFLLIAAFSKRPDGGLSANS
jgi:apolipoprotein N-acyltransferase